MQNVPDDAFRYVVLDYLPFRELYVIRTIYPEEYQERLSRNLNDKDSIQELLLTALEFKDNNLLDLVIDELLKFHPDYPYLVEDFLLGKGSDDMRDVEYYADHGHVLSTIYSYLLTVGDDDAIALILSTDGKTGNERFDEWILGHEKLDYPMNSGIDFEIRILLSDKVASTIGDDLTWIYGINISNTNHDYVPEIVDIIYRLYEQRGYIPSGILRSTGLTEEEVLKALEELSEMEPREPAQQIRYFGQHNSARIDWD